MAQVCIGLGSNLGDSKRVFQAVIKELSDLSPGSRVSSLYRTKPQDFTNQPDFYNCAMTFNWNFSFLHLLNRLLEIEIKYGRVRDAALRHGPRTIDLDLLWIDGFSFDTPALVVPHPRLTSRAFALVPFLELIPRAVNPLDGVLYTISEDVIETQGIKLDQW